LTPYSHRYPGAVLAGGYNEDFPEVGIQVFLHQGYGTSDHPQPSWRGVILDNPLKRFSQVWAIDTEYIAHPGEHVIPVCLTGYKFRTGKKIEIFQDQLGPEPPFDISSRTLFVVFSATAELGFFRSAGWPQPARVLDLFTEYGNRFESRLPRARSLRCGDLRPACSSFALHRMDANKSCRPATGRAIDRQRLWQREWCSLAIRNHEARFAGVLRYQKLCRYWALYE
jgi:hypothetical protein